MDIHRFYGHSEVAVITGECLPQHGYSACDSIVVISASVWQLVCVLEDQVLVKNRGN